MWCEYKPSSIYRVELLSPTFKESGLFFEITLFENALELLVDIHDWEVIIFDYYMKFIFDLILRLV